MIGVTDQEIFNWTGVDKSTRNMKRKVTTSYKYNLNSFQL